MEAIDAARFWIRQVASSLVPLASLAVHPQGLFSYEVFGRKSWDHGLPGARASQTTAWEARPCSSVDFGELFGRLGFRGAEEEVSGLS